MIMVTETPRDGVFHWIGLVFISISIRIYGFKLCVEILNSSLWFTIFTAAAVMNFEPRLPPAVPSGSSLARLVNANRLPFQSRSRGACLLSCPFADIRDGWHARKPLQDAALGIRNDS